MASGYINGSTDNGWISARAKWSSTVVPGENASLVDVTLQLKKSSRSGQTATAGTGYWTIRVAGVDTDLGLGIEDGSVVYCDDTWRDYVSVKGQRVGHNADGSRLLPIRITGGMPGTDYTKTTLSGSVQLDQIVQACALVSVTPAVEVGSGSLAITISRPREDLHAVATISLGDLSQDVVIAETSYSFAVPAEWGGQISGQSMTGSVTLRTYADSTMAEQIGSESTAAWLATLPTGSGPTLAPGWASVAAVSEPTSGIPAGWGVALAGRSRAQVAFDESRISLSDGAAVASYAVTVAGQTYGAPYLTDVLDAPGTVAVVAAVTDTRGRTASETLSLDVLPYTEPTLSRVGLYRSNSAGAGSEAGGYIYASAEVTYASVAGLNTIDLRARYRQQESTTWSDWQPMVSGDGILMGGGELDPGLNYVGQISAIDALGAEAVYSETMIATGPDINVAEGGGGVGFGLWAQRGKAAFAWPIEAPNYPPTPQSLGIDMQIGNVSGVGTSSVAVTFQREMPGTPVVLVSQNSGNNSPAKVTSVTSKGFSIAADTANCAYRYIAIWWGGD